MQQNKFQRIAVVLIIVVGMGLISYPLFSSIVNSFRQDDVVTTYDTVVSSLNSDDIEKAYEDAQVYNESLLSRVDRFEHTDVYNTLPGIVEDGMIGYVDIPKINVHLPIYHGTSDVTLSNSIGHMEGTSFPVEGKGVHSVLVGHSGMMQQDMFTNITQLEVGDLFSVTVANREIIYEVDSINTVLPEDTSLLNIDPDKNYCTLLTCVPYGVNSHRLLVRGHQTDINDYSQEELRVKHNKIITKTNVINIGAFCIGVILICVIAVIVFVKRRRHE